MKFNEYQFNEAGIEEGIWKRLPSGIRVKVASIRSPKYKAAIVRLKAQYADKFDPKDEKMVDRITCEAMAGTVLLDWEDAEDDSGKPLAFSVQIAVDMLYKYKKFREEVSVVATDDSNYMAKKAIAKK